MLVETKIRTVDHSITSVGCVTDSVNPESKNKFSLTTLHKNRWADLIWKVETQKAVSAFEEPITHFSPRVKAFLIKS